MATKIEELIDKYTINKETKNKTKNGDIELASSETLSEFAMRTTTRPTELPMDSYFNVEGVMTPYVSIWFADQGNTWINLQGDENNNYQNNYFESMTIEDNGFLTLTLTLIDKTNYRVQRLVSNALKAKEIKNSDEASVNKIEVEKSDNKITLDIFKDNQKNRNNLRIRYGYADQNMKMTDQFREVFGKSMGLGGSYTWGDDERYNEAINGEIESGPDAAGKKYKLNAANRLSRFKRQTTLKSYEEEFMIIGYNSQITNAGIRYTIKAIQSASFEINCYKMVQSYNKLVGTPREIMAFFMKNFNEPSNSSGSNSNIKVVWLNLGLESQKTSTIKNFEEEIISNEGVVVKREVPDERTESREEEINRNIDDANVVIGRLKDERGSLKFLQGLFSNSRNPSDNTEYLNINEQRDFHYEDYVKNIANLSLVLEDGAQESSIIELLNTAAIDTDANRDGWPNIWQDDKREIFFKSKLNGEVDHDENRCTTYGEILASSANDSDMNGFLNKCISNTAYISTCNNLLNSFNTLYDRSVSPTSVGDIIISWIIIFCAAKFKRNINSVTSGINSYLNSPTDKKITSSRTIGFVGNLSYDNYDKESIKLAMKLIDAINKKNINKIKSVYNDISNTIDSVNEKIRQKEETISRSDSIGENTKRIEIVLGSNPESQNGSDPTRNIKRYKTISSIFTDYANQCPTSYDTTTAAKTYTTKDNMGNEIVMQQEDVKIPRKMTWSYLGKDKTGSPVVGFYYSVPIRNLYIRRYDWGTGNPKQHCIKDLNVTSNTEYATMLSQATFVDGNSNTEIKIVNDGKEYTSNSNNSVGTYVNVVSNKDEINKFAKENIYRGTMTILGDPSLRFEGTVQPYNLPIKINVKLMTEGEVWAKSSDKKDEYISGQDSALSGYYVITKITHSINSSGYYTTLDIMKYPGIEDDV